MEETEAEQKPRESAERDGENAGEASDESPGPKVLSAPSEAVEPLARLVDEGQARVLKRQVVDDLEHIADGLERARRRGEEIVEEARREADRIREEAREEGRREGYEELVSKIAEVRERYRTIQDEAEEDTLELAFRIARRIVGREIDRDPSAVGEIVADALEEVRGKRHVVVHVHPEDIPGLEERREELAGRLDGASIFFEADADLERGGCVIETDANRVDATLQMQLDRLRAAVEGSND